MDEKMQYLQKHPEIKYLVTAFISETMYLRPKQIAPFATKFFANQDVHDYVASLCGFDTANEHIRAIYYKIQQEAEEKRRLEEKQRKMEEIRLAQLKAEEEEEESSESEIEIALTKVTRQSTKTSKTTIKTTLSRPVTQDLKQTNQADQKPPSSAQQTEKSEAETSKTTEKSTGEKSEKSNEKSMSVGSQKQPPSPTNVTQRTYKVRRRLNLETEESVRSEMLQVTNQEAAPTTARKSIRSTERVTVNSAVSESPTVNIEQGLQKVISKKTKKRAKPKEEEHITNEVYKDGEPDMNDLGLSERLNYMADKAIAAYDLKQLTDIGTSIIFFPTDQELACSPEKFTSVVVASRLLGRVPRVVKAGGIMQDYELFSRKEEQAQPAKLQSQSSERKLTQQTPDNGITAAAPNLEEMNLQPHVHGVGLREYTFGLGRMKTKRPDTTFVLTNVDDYVSKFTRSELRTIKNCQKTVKMLHGRHNSTNFQDLVKFAPVIFRGNMKGKSVQSTCVVFVSFVPPSSAVDALIQGSMDSDQCTAEEKSLSDLKDHIYYLKKQERDADNFYADETEKLQVAAGQEPIKGDDLAKLQIKYENMKEEVTSLEPDCILPAYPRLCALNAANFAEIKKQTMDMANEADGTLDLYYQNIYICNISAQKPFGQFDVDITSAPIYDNPTLFFDYKEVYAQASGLTQQAMNGAFEEQFVKQVSSLKFYDRINLHAVVQGFKSYDSVNGLLRPFFVGDDNISELEMTRELTAMLAIQVNARHDESKAIFRRLSGVVVNRAAPRNVLQYITAKLQNLVEQQYSMTSVLLVSRRTLAEGSVLDTQTDAFQEPQVDAYFMPEMNRATLPAAFPRWFSAGAQLVKTTVTAEQLEKAYQIAVDDTTLFVDKERPDRVYSSVFGYGIKTQKVINLKVLQKTLQNRFGNDLLENIAIPNNSEEVAAACVQPSAAAVSIVMDLELTNSRFGLALKQSCKKLKLLKQNMCLGDLVMAWDGKEDPVPEESVGAFIDLW